MTEANSPNILVVEDDEASRELVEELLTDEGYRVATAANGVEALGAIQQNHYDLVVSDLAMPRMDGIELFQKVRALPDGSAAVPFIFISASEGHINRAKRQSDRPAAFMHKPIDHDALIEHVQDLLLPAISK